MADHSTADGQKRSIIGRVGSCFGIRGWVRIESYTRPLETIFDYKYCFLSAGDCWKAVQFAESARQGRKLVARFESFSDRNQAETLKNKKIAIERSQLDDLDEGQYYWHDLVGLRVVDQMQRSFGQINHLLETGANDVMVVLSEQGGAKIERLIPYLPDVVLDVDLEQGLMVVDWSFDWCNSVNEMR